MINQEFVVATNLTTAGSAEDKLRWAFRMYDKDGSGEHDHCVCSHDDNHDCHDSGDFGDEPLIDIIVIIVVIIIFIIMISVVIIIPMPRYNRHGGAGWHCYHILWHGGRVKVTLVIIIIIINNIIIIIIAVIIISMLIREKATERAEQIFRVLDVNGDGNLDEEEFCKWDHNDGDGYDVDGDGGGDDDGGGD